MLKDLGLTGTEAALFLSLATVYFVSAWAPIWIPLLRVAIQKPRLPKKFIYVVIVSLLTSGVIMLITTLVVLPLGTYIARLAPTLAATGHSVLPDYFGAIPKYYWLFFPPLVLLSTFVIDRKLSRVWHRISAAIDG
jgi:hypothetical protein